MSRQEIRFSGFGGQGIILSGQIVGKAATIFDNKYATLTQNYGPESRGGSCSVHLVVSEKPVLFPNVIDPSVQLLMSQEAFNKYYSAAPGGLVTLIDEDLVQPSGEVPSTGLLAIPATRIAGELGRKIVANIVMLGSFAAATSVVSEQALRQAIQSSVPRGTEELNTEAFNRGYRFAQELLRTAGP
ncbi:MAG: 2-oxoacid:acceptor oxidoreductase family protein [Chloroflexi bacterium]|nr:2-oxoacid:acceptor oxidoreductase family protein [Chloroflexota bacterium]MDA8187212.1 2-oxoacid:acceptor oxidoreductase family protein [Dehalococcoidales bacterium]